MSIQEDEQHFYLTLRTSTSQKKLKSGGLREQRIREAGIEAITQSTAVAKINRSSNATATHDDGRLYKAGDLIDYHRPTATKDESGGWNGPFFVIQNEPIVDG